MSIETVYAYTDFHSAMSHVLGITPVVAVLRAVGCFPYTLSPGHQTVGVRVSWVAAAWSVVVVIAMMVSCVASITMHYTRHHASHNIMKDILITYWYLLLLVLYIYLATYAHRLAGVLRLLMASGVSVRRRIWGMEDTPVMVGVVVFLAGTCLSLAFTESSSSNPVSEVLKQVVDRTADLTITVLLTVLYALVKLLSVEMEDTVTALAYATTRPQDVGVSGDPALCASSTSKQSFPPQHTPPATSTQHPPTPQQHLWTPDNDSFHTNSTALGQALSPPPPTGRPCKPSAVDSFPSPVLHLLALDDIIREVVGYASPPLLLLLLNAAASTTMFLYNAIATSSAYYIGFISVLVARMVQIVLIPDPMTRKVSTLLNLVSSLVLMFNIYYYLETNVNFFMLSEFRQIH